MVTLKFSPRITKKMNRQTNIQNIFPEILLDFNFFHSQNFLHNVLLHRLLSLLVAKLTSYETDKALVTNKFLLILPENSQCAHLRCLVIWFQPSRSLHLSQFFSLILTRINFFNYSCDVLIISSNFLFNLNPSVNLFPSERKGMKMIDCHFPKTFKLFFRIEVSFMIFLQTITDPMTVSQCENYYSDITVSFNITKRTNSSICKNTTIKQAIFRFFPLNQSNPRYLRIQM